MKQDMNEITINGITYVKKEIEEKPLERENSKELYREVEYAGYTWNMIAEDDDGITLAMRNVLSREDMEDIFGKDLLDDDGDIRFNYQYNDIWWKNSPIRMGLNSNFLKRLNRDDLVLMESTLTYDDKSDTTLDYVRLLSKEEIEDMPSEIRQKNAKYGYWSFSPHYFYGSRAYVFYVSNRGYLSCRNVDDAFGVAPVIKLSADYCQLKGSQK